MGDRKRHREGLVRKEGPCFGQGDGHQPQTRALSSSVVERPATLGFMCTEMHTKNPDYHQELVPQALNLRQVWKTRCKASSLPRCEWQEKQFSSACLLERRWSRPGIRARGGDRDSHNPCYFPTSTLWPGTGVSSPVSRVERGAAEPRSKEDKVPDQPPHCRGHSRVAWPGSS